MANVLTLIVGEDGIYEWASTTMEADEVAFHLREIAERIWPGSALPEAGPGVFRLAHRQWDELLAAIDAREAELTAGATEGSVRSLVIAERKLLALRDRGAL